jgi:predicted nucleic acid-binding protein
MAVKAFLDTSVLLSGLIDFGVQSRPAQRVFDLVADRALPKPSTAWHCCLEFYSVATRMPAEFRLSPSDAERLLKEEILGRLAVHDLPPDLRLSFLAAAARDDMIGGRIYDAHIAEVARSAGADVIVTDNRRHFLAALRHGLRVETPEEYLESINRKP